MHLVDLNLILFRRFNARSHIPITISHGQKNGNASKRVVSNDYMSMGAVITKALIENNSTTLGIEEARQLLVDHKDTDFFVEKKFKGLYFSDEDNHFIDIVRANIKKVDNPYKKAIAMQALIRACTKKRPRGIFTYVGHRYDDGRK